MVGQSENSLMPWRISESWSTSTVVKATPRWSRIATARLEKPHCGKSAVPFMNKVTSFELTMSAMRALVSDMVFSLFGYRGGELERVQFPTHARPQRLVDAL